jgi:hypothetical protein
MARDIMSLGIIGLSGVILKRDFSKGKVAFVPYGMLVNGNNLRGNPGLKN